MAVLPCDPAEVRGYMYLCISSPCSISLFSLSCLFFKFGCEVLWSSLLVVESEVSCRLSFFCVVLLTWKLTLRVRFRYTGESLSFIISLRSCSQSILKSCFELSELSVDNQLNRNNDILDVGTDPAITHSSSIQLPALQLSSISLPSLELSLIELFQLKLHRPRQHPPPHGVITIYNSTIFPLRSRAKISLFLPSPGNLPSR